MPKRLARSISGFSLIEMLVSLVILSVVVLSALAMFDRSNKMTKTETSVSDAQQNSRYASYEVVRMARMAGAGGILASYTDDTGTVGTIRQAGVSLNLGSSVWGAASKYKVNNINVGGNDLVCIGGSCGTSSAHHIKSGTDILHIRGVLTNAVYDLSGSSWTPPSTGTVGTLVIEPCTKFTDLSASGACSPYGTNDMSVFPVGGPYPTGKLFLMTDSLGNTGIGKITTASATASAAGTVATLTIDIGDSTMPATTYPQSLCKNGVFPTSMTSPSRGGVVDDRVYFIDDGTDSGKSCTSTYNNTVPGPCHPVLSVADWVDGDLATAPFSTATVAPIAEDVEDMQVAYGVDFSLMSCTGSGNGMNCSASGSLFSPATTPLKDPNGALIPEADGSISITTATKFASIVGSAQGTTAPGQDPSEDTSAADKDEWIFNVAGEPAIGTFDYTSDLSRLKALEINIVAKGENPDPKFASEGSIHWLTMDSGIKSVTELMSPQLPFRRRLTSTRVSIRNFQYQ